MKVQVETEAGRTLRILEMPHTPRVGDHFFLFSATDNDRYAIERLTYVVYGDRQTDEHDQVKPTELAHCVATLTRVAD